LGIVQEQHAERTHLYKQWKQYQWPIVQDSLNLLDVTVVPLLIAVDEEGVVVSHRASVDFLEKWLAGEVAVTRAADAKQVKSPLATARDQFLWGSGADTDQLNAAIQSYESFLQDDADDAKANFEIAVCYRHRFERDGHVADFQKAIDHWSQALRLKPNQYIYRRRIEQYGARLGKPYPFFEWVATAQEGIRARGGSAFALRVAVSGAEIASPVPKFASDPVAVDWDSATKIDVDDAGLVEAEAVVVRLPKGRATRVHVLASVGSKAKWNNEAGPTSFVLQPLEGVKFSKNGIEAELPDEAESGETRRFEFEVVVDSELTEPVTIRGAVLVNVCATDTGVCTYVRKPFEVTVQPTPQ